jgi:hypothetical protein
MLSKLSRLFRKRQKRAEMNHDLRAFNPLYTYYAAFDARKAILDAKPDLVEATQGTVTNFLGVKVPVQVMPSILSGLAGTIEPVPEPGNWHADIAEWAGALRSVAMAKDRYQIIELGCGWGCWINNMGVAAKARGLDVRLIGIEGDQKHLKDAEMTLALNGFDPSQYRLVHGVAGPTDGMAFFPKLGETNEVWGAEAIFYPDQTTADVLRTAGQYQELKCYTLPELSEGVVTDLLHIDIQGAEVAFIQSNLDSMRKTVRRVLIGTHSRVIDGQIMDILVKDGWELEIERPAIHEIVSGRPEIRIDGVQLWLNVKLL